MLYDASRAILNPLPNVDVSFKIAAGECNELGTYLGREIADMATQCPFGISGFKRLIHCGISSVEVVMAPQSPTVVSLNLDLPIDPKALRRDLVLMQTLVLIMASMTLYKHPM